jgi:nucleoid-associated protein YgaU
VRRAVILLVAPWLLAGAATAPDARIHEVRPGETLWQIAQLTVGDPTLWPALYHANRDPIKDPARVYPGQRLAIPTIEPGEREALRREARTLNTR